MMVRAFQTGNIYTEHGQRIAYALRDDGYWQMRDFDRGISYILNIDHPSDEVMPRDIYRAYMNINSTEDLILYDDDGKFVMEDYDLTKVLRAAANRLTINHAKFAEQILVFSPREIEEIEKGL